MSTAAIEFFPADVEGLRVPSVDSDHRGRRGAHLRLVGFDERPAAEHGSTMRLTRRGRLTLASAVALALALGLGGLVGDLAPAGAASAVVVEPGMTLSQIAAEQLPELPLSQAITDIQRANRLSTTDIAVGQELLIPGR